MLKRCLFIPAICLVVVIFWALPALGEMIVDTAWVRRYNGPGNDLDEACAIAVDGFNNLYVAGYSFGNGSDRDYATVKYYPNGDTSWVRRYNGPENDKDWASAVAIDGSNNVYVTGYTYSYSAYYDYATIKYNSNGDTVWVRTYDGPGNDMDRAYAITVDDSNNVYVTGASNNDYATIRYYPQGETAWVRRYDGPGNSGDGAYAIAIDDSNNIYVTGVSVGNGTHWDYATIKYYPNGDTVWVRRYNGPGNYLDEAHAIAVDDSGNIYVTGRSVGEGTSFDYSTIKYYPNGDTAWVRRYNGSGNDEDYATAIAVDGSGNVYVTGASAGAGSFPRYFDYASIKYYSNGDTAWVRRYDGSGNDLDVAYAIAVDGSGNVYVTGTSYGTGTGQDYATIKYYPNGDTAWIRRYNGPRNSYDKPNAIALDDSNNVYVTGLSDGIGTFYDYATIKYFQALRGDANGNGAIDIADVVYLMNYLFTDGPAPDPLEAGDANCDGIVDIADVVYLINYLFIGGPPPACE